MAAMKAGDAVVVPALRSVLSALANAEAVPVDEQPTVAAAGSEHFAGAATGVGASESARRRLSEADEMAIIDAEVAERIEAAAEAERSGYRPRADQLNAEAAVLSRYRKSHDQ
jgi:uncharacterized protein YqeY